MGGFVKELFFQASNRSANGHTGNANISVSSTVNGLASTKYLLPNSGEPERDL